MTLHISQLKRTLFHREKKGEKSKERLFGDGHPRVLTGDNFLRLVKEHHEAAQAAVVDASKKKELRVATAQLKAVRKTWDCGRTSRSVQRQRVVAPAGLNLRNRPGFRHYPRPGSSLG